MKIRFRVLLCVIVYFSFGSAHTEGAVPGEGFDPLSYRLELSPDMSSGSVSGVEHISLRTNVYALRKIAFSENALSIDSANVDGIPARVTHRGDSLEFDFENDIPKGIETTLSVRYHGTPERGINSSTHSIYTSYFACDWMVCLQEKPGDKAMFSLDLRVPDGMSSLSVGRLVKSRQNGDGSKTDQWRSSEPYSAYLYGFALGRYARWSEKRHGDQFTYLSDVANATELRRRFSKTPDMVEFFSAKAGFGLTDHQYTQLLVTGDEAQEAATYSIIGKDALPKHPGDFTEDWVIEHELAHQWWGNAVTCATWTDFWLNEGITTFMTAAWKERAYGKAAYDSELSVARARLSKAIDQGVDRPLAWAGKYPTLGFRRAIQYSKGALFLDFLRTFLGDDLFWRGIRRFSQTHAESVATSADFQHAFEQVSKRNLKGVFKIWVFGP